MATAGEPVLVKLSRTTSLSASVSSSIASLEELEPSDIDAIVNRRWRLDDVIGPLRARTAVLSGGRDRRGAPIITMFGTDVTDFRMSTVARLLSYLSKAADESLQGLGFTVIVDMRQTSWRVTKKVLKAIQLTFVEHVYQVLVVKPKAFWQRQKTGMTLTMKKLKYNFPVVMLEGVSDLSHHLQLSQVTRDLGGSLPYEHDLWIDSQRTLEKHMCGLLERLEDFERLREQFEETEELDNLTEARDAVRRHVEVRVQLDKATLDGLSEGVAHTIAKMRPCNNHNFLACFSRLEELCSELQACRDQLECSWQDKGGRLDKVLQLRIYETDSEQLVQWVRSETAALGHTHTDIGESLSTAELRRQAFEELRARVNLKHQELSRILQMGDRLVGSHHPGADMMRARGIEMRGLWDILSSVLAERRALLALSLDFHTKQDKFFLNVEPWGDECSGKEQPATILRAEQLLEKHKKLRDCFQELYAAVRNDGHKIIEKLRKPVGESSLPAKFVVGTRHVKESLESLYDEKNWLDEQWETRQTSLQQALCFRKFQAEAGKVSSWLADTGNPFLSHSNGIGGSYSAAQRLLQTHDEFETETEAVYGLANKLFSRARELVASGEGQKEPLEREARTLEDVVGAFASRLDERREVILDAGKYYQLKDAVLLQLAVLDRPVPRDRFDGSSLDAEPQLEDSRSQRTKVDQAALEFFQHCEVLKGRLAHASSSALEAGSAVDYSAVVGGVGGGEEEVRVGKERVDAACDARERRWILTTELDQFKKDVQKHLVQQEAWSREQEQREWEPADVILDAQLVLDAFQRQYDQITSSHTELVARGRSVAKEIVQSDDRMFGAGSSSSSAAHVVTREVEGEVGRMGRGLVKMEAVAGPKLQQHRDCLQYHLLQQRNKKLSSALSSLAAALSRVFGVGHTLPKAQAIHQQATEINHKLKAVLEDVVVFSEEVQEGVERQHYQAVALATLARSLGEKGGGVSRAASERLRIIASSVEFHLNLQRLSSSMKQCRERFSSKVLGKSVADMDRLLSSNQELIVSVSQTAEDVHSQGRALLDIIASSGKRRSSFNSNSTQSGNGGSFPSEVVKRAHSSDDILDAVEKSSDTHKSSFDVSTSAGLNSPKLLSTPAKTRRTLKTLTIIPSFKLNEQDQEVIENLLNKMETGLASLKQLWASRKNLLEQSEKFVDFCENVPEVLKWLETVGLKFLEGRQNYGRSIEKVKSLMEEHSKFEKTEMAPFVEKVRLLRESYDSVERTGHDQLNELRGLHAELEEKWGAFEERVRTQGERLELCLKFQETIFASSNWCQTSQQFLNSLEERVEQCDQSEEVARLSADLAVYLSVTQDQQTQRIMLVKEIGSFLRSNLLAEQAVQVEASSQHTLADFQAIRADLERRHTTLLQIEEEKDREKRLVKQRERVLEELLETELLYVADLKLVVEKCRPRFVSELLPHTLKGKEETVFSNIADVESFHKRLLLPKLQSCHGDLEATAGCFLECAEEMVTVYVPYCKDRAASEELLASHRSYLNRVQALFGTATPLSSLLIKPVQRITKYPLLLKDALKYTRQLGQTCKALEVALKSVERIPVATNNAIHLSSLENFNDAIEGLGRLLLQGLLQVSEPKFGIKAEKERQVFAFDRCLLFARKVELPQAKFKYEYKFKIEITSSVQILEFFEGDAGKFAVITGDHRLHLKTNSVDTKQDWVKALRTAILEKNTYKPPPSSPSSSSSSSLAKLERPVNGAGGNQLTVESWSKDLLVPSPVHSPLLAKRKMNGGGGGGGGRGRAGEVGEERTDSPEFEKYRVTEDYRPGEADLPLSKGDIVEVLDNGIDGRWFVRTVARGGGANSKEEDCGWIPSGLLERLRLDGSSGGSSEGDDEADAGGGVKKKRERWVQITAGPLSGSSDEEKWRQLKQQTAFGSHDLQSQAVISTLKKVTFGLQKRTGGGGEEEEQESSSLDAPMVNRVANSPRTTRSLSTPGDYLPPPLPSPSSSPHRSPRHSPHTKRRATDFANITTSELEAVTRGEVKGVEPDTPPSGIDRERTSSSTKSRWRRHAVIRRKNSGGRSNSVGSDFSETQSESPTEKMFHSSSEETVLLEDTRSQEPLEEEGEEEEEERTRKALLKRKYIVNELLDTERQYVSGLEDCINGYMKEMRSPNLPDALKGKERVIFGNIQDLYTFHKTKFLGLLDAAQDSLEDISQCFLDQSHDFEVYVVYCENKPKSEAFLWTYQHSGGTFFEDIQNQLGHRQGINSFLIKPVQRITKYQLLLRDLHKSAQKSSLDTPQLEKALQVMHDIPKRANDAMTLSMIYGYEGNIHAHGQIILQDEFTVYERTRWTAAHRQIFLLDQRLVITKEKDADGLYVYKDSLKVHSLTLAEKEGDNPARFAVGTGPIGSWDQYYVLEASSMEKKQLWVQAIKDILQRQFELLKALKQPAVRGRSKTMDALTAATDPLQQSVGMIYASDDSDLDEEEEEGEGEGQGAGPASPWSSSPAQGPTTRRFTVAEATSTTPTTAQPHPLHLYEVAEDCAPPKDNEGILYVHRGEIYDVSDTSSDWWFGRLVRDVGSGGEGGVGRVGRQGWVPGSFLDLFRGSLTAAEETAYYTTIEQKQQLTTPPDHTQLSGTHSASSLQRKREKTKKERRRFGRTRSLEYSNRGGEGGEGGEGGGGTGDKDVKRKVDSAPVTITAHLSNETVITSRSVQFKCQYSPLSSSSSSSSSSPPPPPPPSVEWKHDGARVCHERAFTSSSEAGCCVLRIKEVIPSDGGSYTCAIGGIVSSTARLTVLSAPDPPSSLVVKPLTSTSVSISWAPPTFTGHSPITIYLVECKDTCADRWSTLMKRITEPSTVVQDLMPGLEYVFRVICGNHIGSSDPSRESVPIQLARAPLDASYSHDPFEGQYNLLREIGWGRFGVVYECVHNTTQQTYAAKLVPLGVGPDHAHHELAMLAKLDHPNLVQLTSAFLTETHFVLLFPLIRGSGLLEYFVSRDCLSEAAAVGCVEQILAALDYLHSASIAHLDIKPENIMAVEVAASPVPDIKLTHFERARELCSPHGPTTIPKLDDHIEFEAPEVLLGEPVSFASDMWALGVVIYTLLGGSSPFLVDSRDLMKDNIVSVRFSFPVKGFRELASSAKELISSLLQRDPSERLSPAQCHAHPWLATQSPKASTKLSTAKLKTYVASRKWQSSLLVKDDETFSRL